MAESVDFLSEGTALVLLDLEVVEVGSSSAREEVRCGVAVKLKVLQVVVVAGEVEVDVVLAEERIPITDEDGVVSVWAV